MNDCAAGNTYQNKQPAETLGSMKTPDLPWVEVAADIFEWERTNYLVTVGYYSKYIEVHKLENLSSTATIDALKCQMSRQGIAEKFRSYNATQFSPREFTLFCTDYQIDHCTLSPAFLQSNGEAERAVQTVKRLWRKCTDKHLALLDYRKMSMESCNLSPTQLHMSHRPRNNSQRASKANYLRCVQSETQPGQG